jgi:hypothetical protein
MYKSEVLPEASVNCPRRTEWRTSSSTSWEWRDEREAASGPVMRVRAGADGGRVEQVSGMDRWRVS